MIFGSEKQSGKFHLTLSVIIERQGPEALLPVLKKQIRLTESISKVEYTPGPNSIYLTPPKLLHASLVHFFETKPEEQSFEEFRKTFLANKAEYIEGVKDVIEKECRSVGSTEAYIRGVFPRVGIDEKCYSSVALQLHLSESIFRLARSICKTAIDRGLTTTAIDDKIRPIIKAITPENPAYCPVNIIRFVRLPTDAEENELADKMRHMAEELVANPIELSINCLSLVISDDYLANSEPEIEKFVLADKERSASSSRF